MPDHSELGRPDVSELGNPDASHPGNPVVRVLIVDDHDLFGQSLALALRAEGFSVQRATDLTMAALIDLAKSFAPAVVLLDLDLGPDGPTGIAVTPQLCELDAEVVMVTGIDDPARMGECLSAGALSVVNKSEPYEALIRAVHAALDHRSVMSEARRHELLEAMRAEQASHARATQLFDQLTATEKVVLARLMEGKSAESIAEERFVAVRTVRTQIESIHTKLGVRSQLGAVALAWRHGWSLEGRDTGEPLQPES